MKLFATYNRVNLLTTVIVILITGLIYYQVISLILTNQLNKDLEVEEQEILDFVKLNHQLPQVFDSNDQQITFSKPQKTPVKRSFISTYYYNKKEKEPGRGLIMPVNVNGKWYQATISESTVETEDLIKIIFTITIGIILLLITILFFINRFILNRLWQAFYAILSRLSLFNVTNFKEEQIPETTIDEFNQLNEAVEAMSARVRKEYLELKKFTEHAAHELLTPIAIINSKLDTLIQTDNFSKRQSELLSDLYGTVSRLKRLNKAMLLLVKIENGLVEEEHVINLKEMITERLASFQELFLDKELAVSLELESKAIRANNYLIEILLNNILSNAIRHNNFGGKIKVILNQKSLVIQNTGTNLALNNKEIFRRFNKSTESEGSGLGLTIAKQICENYHYQFSYAFYPPFHNFKIDL
ncbi:sensor histidine kinase [Mucilaginibacter arboris]|uniref:histidine kinase n=1 Tax=Mucilaginibacter arboris TaxID=2682090 RepID=A0A7K1SVZ9_9SPHI|nr:HAMP domain-containing sensor histidine kinase [Mucilaginibacter arboris]MVN21417.1 sensor histidine kinase [Mucilaginibacter arboris]